MRATLTLLAFLASQIVIAQQQVHRQRGSQFIVQVGQEAPRFSFITSDGDTLDSDLLHGQVVLIDFAASWCPFTPAQMEDHQNAFWQKYSGNPAFSMFTICEDFPQDRHYFNNIAKEAGVTSPIVYDDKEELYQLFVTPNGSVTRSMIIAPDWSIAYLQDKHTRRGMRALRRTLRLLLRDAQ